MITLYHGTDCKSAKQICLHGIDVNINKNRRLDFGPGFYTTCDYARAKMWALRKANTRLQKPAVVTILFDIDSAIENRMITKFDDDLNWGQFVVNNRNGISYIKKMANKINNLHSEFDITYGRIADVDITTVVESLKKEELPLRDEKLILNPSYPKQYVFHTVNSITYIKSINWRPI